jgi:hypothetical protein
MTMRTNRRTKGKFNVSPIEKKILEEYGIKKLTPEVDAVIRLYRENEKNPKSDYLVRWRAATKNFTEAQWDELARRLSIA